MGKDLKGKELGRGLSQRADGRYMGRAQVEGHPIVIYDRKLKEVKAKLAIAIDEMKRSNLLPGMDGKSITLSEWFGTNPLPLAYATGTPNIKPRC